MSIILVVGLSVAIFASSGAISYRYNRWIERRAARRNSQYSLYDYDI